MTALVGNLFVIGFLLVFILLLVLNVSSLRKEVRPKRWALTNVLRLFRRRRSARQ
jgi:hypothetical protein